ncbi:MAG: NUDIX domain-containing protein [Rikenellaceae bacterium]
MNKTIFFHDKYVTFASSPIDNYDLTIDSRADTIAKISRAKVLYFFEKYNSILFLCRTPEQAFDYFCREFRSIKAAGGLVVNDLHQTLMIFRNGRWDLPKGHLERAESIEECALREVSEETGIGHIELGEKITETKHAYILHEEWAIKTTYWYAMRSKMQETHAQEEEGIEKVEWCDQDSLKKKLESTYPTIREVFASALL